MHQNVLLNVLLYVLLIYKKSKANVEYQQNVEVYICVNMFSVLGILRLAKQAFFFQG